MTGDKTSTKPIAGRSAPGEPGIWLLSCDACGTLTFPPGAYGCQRCGTPREQCSTELRCGPFVLRNFVTIHADVMPAMKAPYVIGEVALSDGLVEQALIDVSDEGALRIGMTMRLLDESSGDGAPTLVRFTPA